MRVELTRGWGVRLTAMEEQDGLLQEVSGLEFSVDGVPAGSTDSGGTLWLEAAERPTTIRLATPGWSILSGNPDPRTGEFVDQINAVLFVVVGKTGPR